MNRTLLETIKRPALFARNKNMFWQDPHIAPFLLDAHLSQDHEGASRHAGTVGTSVHFIHQHILNEKPTKIVDFGCGPGLYCEPLAQLQHTVTGIDISSHSIQYAQEQSKKKGLPITYINQDYLSVQLKPEFDLALLIYCDYGALGKEERKQVLQRIYDSLNIGGQLFLDVFTEEKFKRFSDQRYWNHHEHGGFWSPENHLELQQNCTYPDERVSLEQTNVMTADDTQTYYIWNQYFTKPMLQTELEEAGFSTKEVYSDVTGKPYTAKSDTMAFLAKKN
ncbi:class I SAM-dependent methyltransferase [Shouchella sp. 1P09AA]|uniref:class I SAM-dependent methyltransferase n=1 Tax=unclassified Shouchella TaxID=2893065 RepID=UPI0039A23839